MSNGSTTLKIAVFAPMARASVASATPVKADVRRIPRSAYRTSRPTMSKSGRARPMVATKVDRNLRSSHQRVKTHDSTRVAELCRHRAERDRASVFWRQASCDLGLDALLDVELELRVELTIDPVTLKQAPPP